MHFDECNFKLRWYGLELLYQIKNIDYTELKYEFKKNFKIGYSKFWGMEKFFDTSLMEIEVIEKIEETIETLRKNGCKF